MQKSSLLRLMREEVIRALVFSIAFFILICSGFVTLAHAATDGGYFWILLNKILVTAWDSPVNDGTVKNANSLGGTPASGYVPLGTNRTCGGNQCIYGFDASGDVLCR
jgi:hypothetical protein